MVGSETLIQALMRQAVSLLRQQQAGAAVEASRQAFDRVQQVRCLPLLQAQAAALLGRCCTVHSHTASQPAAIGAKACVKHACQRFQVLQNMAASVCMTSLDLSRTSRASAGIAVKHFCCKASCIKRHFADWATPKLPVTVHRPKEGMQSSTGI